MDLLVRAYQFAADNPEQLWEALGQHLLLVLVPLGLGILAGLPLGLWCARSRWAATVWLNTFNALRVVPSLAVLFLAIPAFGLTFRAAAIALTLLAVPPILISTEVAFRTVDPTVIEAALGMGMTQGQVLRRIEIPLALPAIVAGIKTATVEVIASATLAAFIGAGGLGTFITLGFSLYDNAILLVGAIPVAILALLAEVSLSLLQQAAHPSRHTRRSASSSGI
jgi:osmoprotectant transport system permease protein